MFVKIIALMLSACMMLTGCDVPAVPEEGKNSEQVVADAEFGAAKGMVSVFTDIIRTIRDKVLEAAGNINEVPAELGNVEVSDKFNTNLISYINNSKHGSDNYVVSPLSLKMAVSMLAEGANGDTLDQILAALDVSNVQALRDLAASYKKAASIIGSRASEYENGLPEWYKEEAEVKSDEAKRGTALMVKNSIWNNLDIDGTLAETYRDVVGERYDAVSRDLKGDLLCQKINSWVFDSTNGMISDIVDESVANMKTVLVNAIYLSDAWLNNFSSYNTKTQKFTTADGEQVDKEFMHQTESCRYYEDEDTKLIVMETRFGFDVVYVLGDESNIDDKLARAEYEKVDIALPKMKVESSFGDHFLVDFMKNVGIADAFDPERADFSRMSDIGLRVSDVIQKAKIETDEDGIEGAAVTAITMETCGIELEPEKPKEFIADHPFSFYVKLAGSRLGVDVSDDLIFYGRIVK